MYLGVVQAYLIFLFFSTEKIGVQLFPHEILKFPKCTIFANNLKNFHITEFFSTDNEVWFSLFIDFGGTLMTIHASALVRPI